MNAKEFTPEEMEDYIIGATFESQTTPLTQAEEEKVAEYSRLLAALSLIDKGVPADLAIDMIEQASETGDIVINIKEDPDTGDYLLSISIGEPDAD